MRIVSRSLAAAAVSITLGAAGAGLAPAAYANPNLGLDVVYRDDVANQISNQLSQQVGHKPGSVSCPRDLVATAGATLRCAVTDAGQTEIDTNLARRSPPPTTGVGATLGATATRTTPRLRLVAHSVLASQASPHVKEPTMFASLMRRPVVVIVTTAGVLTARL
jgi:hypothetical protein